MSEGTQQTRITPSWIAEGERTLRYGLFSNIFLDWEQLLEQTLWLEELGYDSACIHDHPASFGASGCWTTLAMLAVATKRIRLISFISCVYYYHPVLLARMAADVDRASNGRLILGLGIGDDPQEFGRLGIPFPSTRERQKRLEEVLQIVQGLWRGDEITTQGTHFQLHKVNGHPLPVQRPHVPLLIGGGGEQVTLRQVAQYADMSNFGPHAWTGRAFSMEDVKRKYDVLHTYCGRFNRPFESILRSYFVPALLIARTSAELEAKRLLYPIYEEAQAGAIVGTLEEVRQRFQALVDLRIQYFIVYVAPQDNETIEIFAREVMPTLLQVQ